MTDEWQDADWNLFAMGALDETTQRAMQEHLRTQCRACNRSYREAVLVMDALAATVPQENPSPQVADALLARISKPTTPVISIAALPFRQRPVLPWVAAAACALLALWLGVGLEQVSTLLQQHGASLQPAAVPHPVETAPGPAQPGRIGNAAVYSFYSRYGQLACRTRPGPRTLKPARRSPIPEGCSLGAAWPSEERPSPFHRRARSLAEPVGFGAGTDSHRRACRRSSDRLLLAAGGGNRTIAELKAGKAWSTQAVAFLQKGPFRQVELRGVDPGAGNATAVAFYAPDRGLMVLARSLPLLDQEKCYQLWSLHKAGPAIMSVGLLKTDASGTGFLYAPPSQELRQLTGLAITDEPKGGSPSARGHKLLFGALN